MPKILEACSAGCCTSRFVIKLNGRPIGKIEGRWLSQDLDIDLTERRHLRFRKTSWLGSRHELVDLADEQIVGQCDRDNPFFSTRWDLNLSNGSGQLVRIGWFDTAYEYIEAGIALARVDRVGLLNRGWLVDGSGEMEDVDLLLIGLVYHIIIHRQNAQSSA